MLIRFLCSNSRPTAKTRPIFLNIWHNFFYTVFGS